MLAERRTATVRQLVDEGVLERPIDGNHGEIHPKASDFVAHGIPFIMASDLVGGHVDTTHCAFISEEQARSLHKGFAVPGDVLISHKATMGRTAIVDQLDVPFLMLTPQVTYYRVKDESQILSRYLKLYFDSPDFQTLFETWGQKGSTRAYLGITAQLDLPIILPPPAEQRAIAHILGTLEDKIELNRRLNETLEAIAYAIFKSWFVDFDPVRAKAEGHDPGLPKDIADLFPDSLQDSELGQIPEGWTQGSFGNITSQRSERAGNREVVVLSAVANGKLTRSDEQFTKRVYSEETAKYLLVERWDFAYNPSRINIGSIGMLQEDILGGVSPVYVVIRPKAAYQWFLEFSIRRASTKAWINTLASGSVRQSLSYSDFASIPCVIPPVALAQEFNRKWTTIREGIRSREKESETLAALRDTLLPKLISGGLRLKNANRLVERTV